MPTRLVHEMPDREGAQDELYRRTYSRTFLVLSDSRNDGPKTIRELPGIPRVGDKYQTGTEDDPGVFCGSVNARCTSAGNNPDYSQWEVTCTYGMRDPNQFPQNPIEWPLQLEWDFARYQKVVEKTINDNPIVNSANDPFEDPVEVDDDRPVLKITRNEATYDPSWAWTYANKRNKFAFLGAAPGSVKVAGIPGKPVYSQDAGGWYWAVTYTFEFTDTEWIKKILDRGYNTLDATTGLQKPITNGGQKLDEPKLLDGNGDVLPDGATPEFIEFEVYEDLDFAVFNFDFSDSTGGQSW